MKDQSDYLWQIADKQVRENIDELNVGGRPKAFSSPEDLWNKAVEYFEWVVDNPLKATKVVVSQGNVVNHEFHKMRAMTISGLCLKLGIDQKTYRNYRDDDRFFPIISKIDSIINEQKFTGAAADLLNANLIARDLGLHDKTEINNLTVQFKDAEEAERKARDILAKNPDLVNQIISKAD